MLSDCFSSQSSSGNLVSIQPDRFTGLSSNECQVKCQENAQCEYFMIIQSICYLKTESAIHGIKENSNAVWGPKYCAGISWDVIILIQWTSSCSPTFFFDD